jgi:hypothetical protein
MSETASIEMPRYKCHKEVYALKIESIGYPKDGATLTPVDQRYAPISVDEDYTTKHNPQAGGYYVVYADGYESFSPAEAFESGYTLVTA